MLKQTLIVAAAASLMAFGTTDAFAGQGDGHRGGGGHGGGYDRGGKYGGGYHGNRDHEGRNHGNHKSHGWYGYSRRWFTYPYPRCHYEPRKVRIKVWDRRGRPYRKWVWRDVEVC